MIEHYGSSVALRDGRGNSLTYSQMAERVQELSFSLSQNPTHPISTGSRVGVFLSPCMDWVCSLLAILRLGATYVPLDATAGLDRLVSIVQDCKPNLVLVNNVTEPESRRFQPLLAPEQVFNIGDIAKSTYQHAVPIAARRATLAALMYTSGSTGVPKGIAMRHDSFRDSIEIMTGKLSYKEGQEVTLQQSSYNFDMSLCQTFLALSNGGALYIVPRELRGDPVAISSIISNKGISFTTATPSEVASWITYGDPMALRKSAWRVVQSGGEPVRDSLVASFRQVSKPDLRLVDCYGPTEITFCCHSREVDWQAGSVPDAIDGAGKGLNIWPNRSCYIIDSNQRPVPAGVAGEVAIGGSGVVPGYLHSELDARGFITDSWASNAFVEQGWTRLHLTGDTGHLSQTDGSLVLGGRIAGDTQVKLRGLRIDLRDIESAIFRAAEGKVSDVYVAVRESKTAGAESLIAFAVLTAPQAFKDLSRLLDGLPLPQYMRPAALMSLEELPTNASGKVDRLALKTIPFPQEQGSPGPLSDDYSQQLSSMESRLLQLWEQVISHEVLSQHTINKESDFFHVGGSSILLVRLRAEAEKTFATTVSLFRLFEASTLGGMAALVDSTATFVAVNPSSGHSGGTSILDVDAVVQPGQSIDWEAETAVSPSLLQMRAAPKLSGKPRVVVLTGATGFLGQAILKHLLEDSIIQKIHCLAVRRDVSADLPVLFDSPKVVVHRGDLAMPCFGLSEDAVSSIFSEAHAVIHNGADVSFMKSYASLKPINVSSTRELVRLSLPHRVSFHYISTASVAQLTREHRWAQQSVKAYPPPPATDGYVASKWASERYLEKVSDQCATAAPPMWIHRPSSIRGADAPQTDLVTNLLQFAKEVRAVPATTAWSGWLDFVSVGSAARQIVDEVCKDQSRPGSVKYLYESGEEVIPLADLGDVLGRETGSKFAQLPVEEWVARAEAQGLSPLLGEFLRAHADVPLIFTRLDKDGGSLS